MASQERIRVISSSPASISQRARGLLGWLVIEVDGLFRVDGTTLRRTRDGRLTLSFPVRHDSTGRQHSIVRPTDAAARREIESQVFAALGLSEESGP